jgi:hypothetical protein
MLGTSLAKKEDRFKEAARLMLKSGNIQAFCEINMKAGNYEKAIAYAPKVSLKFWKQCVEKYTKFLANPPVEGEASEVDT